MLLAYVLVDRLLVNFLVNMLLASVLVDRLLVNFLVLS